MKKKKKEATYFFYTILYFPWIWHISCDLKVEQINLAKTLPP